MVLKMSVIGIDERLDEQSVLRKWSKDWTKQMFKKNVVLSQNTWKMRLKCVCVCESV